MSYALFLLSQIEELQGFQGTCAYHACSVAVQTAVDFALYQHRKDLISDFNQGTTKVQLGL